MARRVVKVAIVLVMLLAVFGVVGYGFRAVRQALGLEDDPAVRIAELAVEEAKAGADQAVAEAEQARAMAEQAKHEYYEARAQAERVRQEVAKLATEGQNVLWRSVAYGYAIHVASHTTLVLCLVGLTGVAIVGIAATAVVAWRSLGEEESWQ